MLTTILDFISVASLWGMLWILGTALNGVLLYTLCIILGWGDIRMKKVYFIAGILSAITLIGLQYNGNLVVMPYRG